MNPFLRLTLAGALSLGAAACGPKPTGAFDAQGYKNSEYGYRIAGTESLLGDEWQLDNLYPGSNNKLQVKKGDEYLTRYELDYDGDGATDKTVEAQLYDLRYKHLRRDALVWLRTFPLSNDLRGKDLRVLSQRYVDEVSGAGYEAVSLGPNTTIIREKRFAANVLGRGAFTMAGREAYETTFEVANVDEVAISPNARRTRVRIALARTPYTYKIYGANKQVKAEYPVFMLAGYANLPEDFDKDVPAFRGLLARIEIDGKTGVTEVVPDGSPAAAPPAGGANVADPAPTSGAPGTTESVAPAAGSAAPAAPSSPASATPSAAPPAAVTTPATPAPAPTQP